MENFKVDVDADGIAIVTFDMPGREMNTISHAVQEDLAALVQMLRDRDPIVGAVIVSGKDSGFCAGADLAELSGDIDCWAGARSQDELRAALAQAGAFSARVREVETLGKPVVAVVEGVALGGGLELALGCHYRIAVNDERLRLGLPEATLGLMPGAGGTQRLIRLAGLARALPFILEGGPISASDALDLGVVHQTADRDNAVARARQWILVHGQATAPWDVKGFRMPDAGPHSPAGYGAFAPLIAARRGAGDAQADILKAVYEGAQVPIDAGLRIESRYFLNCARRPAAAEGVEAFLRRKETVKA